MSEIITTKIQIRFSDIDVMGHVNNAVYLNYFEYARMNYFNKLVGEKWNWKETGILLANNNIDYLKPLLLLDQVEIETKCVKIGNKSFILEYDLYVLISNEKIKYAQGSSTLVAFNYKLKKSIEVPSELKTKMLS